MLLSDWRNKLNVVLFKLTELSDSFRILQSNDLCFVNTLLYSWEHLLSELAEGTC